MPSFLRPLCCHQGELKYQLCNHHAGHAGDHHTNRRGLHGSTVETWPNEQETE